ncbi:MAG: response regulator, partial [Gammaproteobacteria bacterium]|nr:response regulator [Gammaproteobacteria bacterium]
FSQADASTTREYGGTGLGLTIVKQLIEAMGGEINIRSIVGEGSTFYFHLPLSPAVSSVLETNSNETDKPTDTTTTMTFNGLTALLVEDNKVNQLVAISMLKKIGFEADIAHNGDAAIERLSSRSYDVIFMDCQMPGKDGFETTRIIRNSEIQETVIIAMTANTSQLDKDQCFAAGMNGFIPKPVNMTAITEEVRRFFPQK